LSPMSAHNFLGRYWKTSIQLDFFCIDTCTAMERTCEIGGWFCGEIGHKNAWNSVTKYITSLSPEICITLLVKKLVNRISHYIFLNFNNFADYSTC
jgi:hypothetical protein